MFQVHHPECRAVDASKRHHGASEFGVTGDASVLHPWRGHPHSVGGPRLQNHWGELRLGCGPIRHRHWAAADAVPRRHARWVSITSDRADHIRSDQTKCDKNWGGITGYQVTGFLFIRVIGSRESLMEINRGFNHGCLLFWRRGRLECFRRTFFPAQCRLQRLNFHRFFLLLFYRMSTITSDCIRHTVLKHSSVVTKPAAAYFSVSAAKPTLALGIHVSSMKVKQGKGVTWLILKLNLSMKWSRWELSIDMIVNTDSLFSKITELRSFACLPSYRRRGLVFTAPHMPSPWIEL